MTDLELLMLTTPRIDPLTDPLLVMDQSTPIYDAMLLEGLRLLSPTSVAVAVRSVPPNRMLSGGARCVRRFNVPVWARDACTRIGPPTPPMHAAWSPRKERRPSRRLTAGGVAVSRP